jgi:hypothetical protein
MCAQGCTAFLWLHVVLISTLGACALVAGCVAYSAHKHARHLQQQREAAALDADAKTAEV